MSKKDELTREQKIDLAKGLGKGIVDLAKNNKAAGYTITSLVLLGLGKAKLLSCAVVGTLQGVNTYIAISDVVEESGDAGFFGAGGMGETIAKGASSITIGALWGLECETGRTKYSRVGGPDARRIHDEKAVEKAKELPGGPADPVIDLLFWYPGKIVREQIGI